MKTKKLSLGKNKMVFGVCSGLADYFEIDVSLLRIFWLLIFGFSFLPYIIFWIILSENEHEETK